MRKTLLAIAMSTTLIMGTTTPAEAHHNKLETSHRKYRGILPDAYYDGLARCETGANWKHSTRTYTGGLGIARGTAWRWSGHRNLAKFSPRHQVKIADRIAFTSWTTKKGRKVWRVGPWGWGCLKQTPKLQRYICASNHKLVARWKRGC